MKQFRVIHLVEDLKIGGAERIIADIVESLDRKRFEASVWCVTRGGKIADALSDKGVEVRILSISSYRNPLNIFRLTHLLRRAEPIIVHTHGYFASVISRLAAKKAGIPVIIAHVHSTYWDYHKRHVLIERKLSRFTDKIICCSRAVESFVRDFEKIEGDKTIVIYNGADEERFFPSQDAQSIRAEFGMDKKDPVVGTVSSLTPHKGHHDLLRAASLVLEEIPSVKYLLVGDGPLRERLEEQAKKANIHSSVIFTGEREDIPEVLSLMDVFVLPSSSREGLGLAIIEAMAAGKPVVATEIGGIPEVVKDGETGLLVAPGNPEALARATLRLLRDPNAARVMGEQGRIRFEEKFTKNRMVREIEDLYTDLINPTQDSSDEKA